MVRGTMAGVVAGLLLAGAVDADVVRDGTAGPGVSLQPVGPDYVIPDTMGEYAPESRANLFHSFSDFSLTAAQSATFTGPADVARILARVTGPNPSTIDGLLSTQIDGADLYLLNPRGVMFGKNARLDVSGAFHASTADVLQLGVAGRFAAGAPQTSVLTADPPAAFMFLGNGPVAPILVDESLLAVGTGQSISLVGGDITVRGADHPEAMGRAGSATLRAPSGRIGLISVASAGQVDIAPDGALSPTGFDAMGDVQLSAPAAVGPLEEDANFVLDAAGDPGGRVVIRGGRLTMTQGAAISGATLGDLDHAGVAVDIDVTGEMRMGGFSEIGVSAFAGGDAGDVRIRAGSLIMEGNADSPAFGGFGTNANIGARTFGSAAGGRGGTIDIAADLIRIGNLAFLQTITFGDGDSGDIRLSADRVELVSDDRYAFVSSSSAGSGNAGGVVVEADDVLMQQGHGGGFTGIAVQVRADSQGDPDGGTLQIDARGTVSLLDGAQLNGAVFQGGGNGATIDIGADRLIVRGVARDVAGEIVTAPDFFPSGIYSNVSDFVGFGGTPATGGDIVISAREVLVQDGGLIYSTANFPSAGNAGDIRIDTSSLRVGNSGAIRNDSFGFGLGGVLSVRADDVVISGPSLAPSATGTGLFAQGGTAAESASAINISTGSLSVLDGGVIRTTTFGRAPGGPIDITASDVLVAGVDTAPDDTRFPSGPVGAAAEIVSGSLVFLDFVDFSGGDGGRIGITAQSLEVSDGGRITARSETSGTGGSIGLRLGRALIVSGGEITVSSTQTGDAGDILVLAPDVMLRDGSILAEAEQADGGNLGIFGSRLLLEDGRLSAAVGGGAGSGGNVFVRMDDLIVLERSIISADAFEGPGGSVSLFTGALIGDTLSRISASSELGIDGTVEVNSPETDVEGAIVAPNVRFGDAAALLQSRCSVALGSASALVVTRGDGLPETPDGFLSHVRPGADVETASRGPVSTWLASLDCR